jgi:hypothetical protein
MRQPPPPPGSGGTIGEPPAPAGDATYPAWSMAVSEPAQTYYLNNGWKADDLIKIDYSATFEVKGGSTITFASNGGTNEESYTARWNKNNFECPGVPMIMQPFHGQFVYVTVDSVQ